MKEWSNLDKLKYELSKRPWGIRKFQKPDGTIDIEAYKKYQNEIEKNRLKKSKALEKTRRLIEKTLKK